MKSRLASTPSLFSRSRSDSSRRLFRAARKKRRLLAGLFACTFVAILLRSFLPATEPTASILVTTSTIHAGEALTSENTAIEHWPISTIPDGALTALTPETLVANDLPPGIPVASAFVKTGNEIPAGRALVGIPTPSRELATHIQAGSELSVTCLDSVTGNTLSVTVKAVSGANFEQNNRSEGLLTQSNESQLLVHVAQKDVENVAKCIVQGSPIISILG